MATEAVHAIAGWDDLRHRLDGDQRCYGVLPPCAGQRADRVRRDRAHPRAGRQPARAAQPRRRGRRRRHRDLLLDHLRASPASPACTSATSSSSRWSTSCGTRTTTSRRSRRSRRCPGSGPGSSRRSRTGALTPAEDRVARSRCGRHRCTRSTPRGRRPHAPSACVLASSPPARYLTTARDGRAARPGGQLPPVQRRVARAPQLDGQPRARTASRSRSA